MMQQSRTGGRLLMFQQKLTKLLQLLSSPNFLLLQRHETDMEIRIHIKNLIQIFLLHFRSRPAHLAIPIRKQDLVDDNIVNIDFAFGQLEYQPIGFVH